jgi:1-acyl-sn-glycerol-3-phosphate acyltransferase
MAGETEQRGAAGPEAVADRVLGVVRAFATELRRGAAGGITLDSRLDRDLGLDSLSRAQLVLEVEKALGVGLPEQVAADAQTPRDLVRAVLGAESGGAWRPAPEALAAPAALEAVAAAPDAADTLTGVLDWHVAAHPERPHVRLLEGDGAETVITYGDLRARAGAVAAGLAGRGLEPGRAVAIMLPTGADYLASFYGVLLAGGVPVPIYPPARLAQIEDHLRRHAGILSNARAAMLVTLPEGKAVSRLLGAHVESLKGVFTAEELAADGETAPTPAARTGDTAFLQYTSGSTGRPKGVVLSHANLLANIRAMGTALNADSTDVCVSWLPLYHDMGLIGAWLGSLYYAVPLVLMSPLAFLARPSRWLWAVHRHRGTLAAAPNFAYELCVGKVPEAEIEGLDLSSWRMAANGAEPVSPETLRRFTERFAPYGFAPGAMTPVYGLAECSVGLAFPPPGRGPRIDRVQRDAFTRDGLAEPAEDGDGTDLGFASEGYPLKGHQIRIVDEDGREVPERREGHLQFQGPSATRGYFRNPEATEALFDGDWLDSGDLAYVAGGEVFLTARAKDLIIRAGRNIYPHEVDEAVGEVPGVRKGCVVTFAAHDPRTRTERLVVLAETREDEPETRQALRGRITAVATDLIGEPPDDVVLAPPHTVLKTSSGKIRRADSRRLYEAGRIGARAPGVRLQVTRLVLTAVLPELRRVLRRNLERLHAAWVWTLFVLVGAPTWLGVAVAPGLQRRWRIARTGNRALLRLSGTPLAVEGLEHLPASGAFVAVANHSSYLDGYVLTAALPEPVRFVAKAELAGSFAVRTLLTRLGAQYVERFDLQRGIQDARRLAGIAREGKAVLFFPEGTFRRMPGLQPFHMGAFVAAAEAGVPVVPIAIRGTRSMLREGSWFPRRGRLRVTVCPPVVPEGPGWPDAVALRDGARKALLGRVGEPDLGAEVSVLQRAAPE